MHPAWHSNAHTATVGAGRAKQPHSCLRPTWPSGARSATVPVLEGAYSGHARTATAGVCSLRWQPTAAHSTASAEAGPSYESSAACVRPAYHSSVCTAVVDVGACKESTAAALAHVNSRAQNVSKRHSSGVRTTMQHRCFRWRTLYGSACVGLGSCSCRVGVGSVWVAWAAPANQDCNAAVAPVKATSILSMLLMLCLVILLCADELCCAVMRG